MSLITYSYLSVEIVMVTAYEARDAESLKLPSQIIAYFITLLYILVSIAEMLNINWRDTHLPQIGISTSNGTTTPDKTPPQSSNMAVLVMWDAGFEVFAGFINACLIFSLVSISNTSMYVASRTMYGMTREIRGDNIVATVLRSFSTVAPKTGVPAAALMVSAFSFAWMPFVEYKKGYATQAVSMVGTQAVLRY